MSESACREDLRWTAEKVVTPSHDGLRGHRWSWGWGHFSHYPCVVWVASTGDESMCSQNSTLIRRATAEAEGHVPMIAHALKKLGDTSPITSTLFRRASGFCWR